MKPVTLLTLGACLATGLALGLLGCLKLHFARCGTGRTRLWLLNLFVLLLLAGCGLLADLVGVRAILQSGSVLLCLALLGLAAAGPTEKVATVAVATATVGGCGLFISALLMMPHGLLGSHETAASLHFGLVFLSLGGLLVPVLLDVLLAVARWQIAMAFFGLAALAPAVLSVLVAAEEYPPPARLALIALVSDPAVWLAGLVFFLYAPLEAFVPVWGAAFLRHHGESTSAARWAAYFWGAMALSRVLFGLVQHVTTLGDRYQAAFLVGPALLAAVVLGNLAGSANSRQAGGTVMMLGFFLGPVLPMLLAMVFNLPATAHAPATAVGLFFACGATGSLILAPLVGASSQKRDARYAMSFPLAMSLAVAAVSLFFGLLARSGR